MKKIKVLSLFDGIAGARQALKNLNIDCEYYASEIDKYAIQVSKNNHPDIIHIGDVKDVGFIIFKYSNKCTILDDVDLLIGGSPCQDLSIAKKDGQGLKGERSGLFFEYLRILKEVRPKFFILENVASMKKEAKDEITQHLFGIEPTTINSSLLMAQQRKRHYWVGALQEDGSYKKVEIQPEDKGILLKDILESGETYQNKSHSLTTGYNGAVFWNSLEKRQRSIVLEPIRLGHFNKGGQADRIYSIKGKSVCLSANGGGGGAKTGLYKIDLLDGDYLARKLTPNECARLQGFPDNYHEGVSNTQAYKAYGNSFTVPVIEHIIKQLTLF